MHFTTSTPQSLQLIPFPHPSLVCFHVVYVESTYKNNLITCVSLNRLTLLTSYEDL